jgi:S-formylglutathione hydrolase FrmB
MQRLKTRSSGSFSVALAPALALTFGLAGVSPAQNASDSPGVYERIRVHGESLEGNFEGDSADRDVSVYLPASYAAEPDRRYPVIYLLHGFTDSDHRWYGMVPHFVNVPEVADATFGSGSAREMIIVTPNAYTAFKGSMYSSSPTTGDWEAYVSEDLVAHVDSNYRTIPGRQSRGLAGHSMGGYGAIRIGMKRPDVFSSVYVLSPCCMGGSLSADNPAFARIAALSSIEEAESMDFGVSATLASAAAWSPNPDNPPFYVDLPVTDGELRPDVVARWAAADPLAMLDQYVANLRKLDALAIDVGDMDRGIAASSRILDSRLDTFGVAHEFEVYEGDHVNRIGERLSTHVLPFFSDHLEF